METIAIYKGPGRLPAGRKFDGFLTRSQIVRQLKKIDPAYTPDQPVTIVYHFRTIQNPEN